MGLTRRNNNNCIGRNEKGFTLVEMMLYIAIATVILGSVSALLLMLFSTRVKNETILEVEYQGAQVMELITQTIRNAESVNTPTQGTSETSISLETLDAGTNPTIFDAFENRVRIKKGADPQIFITSDQVTITNLSFHNLSHTDTPGIIRVQFTLSHINVEGRNEYDYSQNFYGSANIKQEPAGP
ncbi:MAG: prepilin-type N-terminal cleavage/methylation domain-containing protein [Patescibacteria group bacterium]|nr:prepilin-type N-terminal cleavage/methylation domain-containing protein [Patescibacteria group bacterium]